MTRIEELRKKVEEYEEKFDELWYAGLSPDEWYEKVTALDKECRPVYGEFHMLNDQYELHDNPGIGTRMTVQHFMECCEVGGFINSDGEGYYATELQESDIPANPAEIVLGFVRKDFPYVVWYNK